MTYEASETSVHGGKPVELYRFRGTYADYYYTSGPEPVEYEHDDDDEPHVYIPIALKRTDITVGTQEDDGQDIQIELSAATELVQVYGFQTSPPRLYLTLFRYHGLDDVKVYWAGPINNIIAAGGRATLRSPSVLGHALGGNIPNVFYQSPCNHNLYDARCKAVEEDWTIETEVTVVSGKTITIDDIGVLTGKVIGGEIKLPSGERRMIVAQAGDVLQVNFPFAELIAGTDCTIVAGCDHLYMGDCKNKFDNQLNFGGFPFIPPENPFSDGIEPPKSTVVDTSCIEPPPAVFEGWYMKVHIAIPTIGGPVTGSPSFFLEDLDTGGIIYNTESEGSPGINGYAVYDPIGFGFTFFWTGYEVPFAANFQLRLQFAAFSMPAGCFALLTRQRWQEFAGGQVAPYSGATLSGNNFDISPLFPRDYYFYL